MDFDAQPVTTFHARAGSLAYDDQIEIRLDAPVGALIGVCRVPCTSGWQQWVEVSCQVTQATGMRSIYLVFRSADDKFVIPTFDPERLFDLESFWFSGMTAVDKR